MRRLLVLSLILVSGFSVAWSQTPPPAAAPAGPDPANFTGKVTGHATSDIRINRYSFEPSARTDWHSHGGGQVIVIEQGRMRTQEWGGPLRQYAPHDTFYTAAAIKHWHGAFPGEPLTQVTMSFGATNWMEAVSDAQYAGGK